MEKARREMIRLGGPVPEDDRPRVYPAIDRQDPASGNTPLMIAAKEGHADVIRMLLEMGAATQKRNHAGRSALDLARLGSNSASLALSIRAPGAASRKKQAGACVVLLDRRSLLQCARDGDIRKVRRHVEHDGENPNLTNCYGQTALHFAAMNRDPGMIRFLVSRGADLKRKNRLGQSPDLILGDETDPESKEALLRAVTEGLSDFRRQERREQQRARAASELASKEAAALRQLRGLTRGTSAARSVFPALRALEAGAAAGLGGSSERGLTAGGTGTSTCIGMEQEKGLRDMMAMVPFRHGGAPESAAERTRRLSAMLGSRGQGRIAAMAEDATRSRNALGLLLPLRPRGRGGMGRGNKGNIPGVSNGSITASTASAVRGSATTQSWSSAGLDRGWGGGGDDSIL